MVENQKLHAHTRIHTNGYNNRDCMYGEGERGWRGRRQTDTSMRDNSFFSHTWISSIVILCMFLVAATSQPFFSWNVMQEIETSWVREILNQEGCDAKCNGSRGKRIVATLVLLLSLGYHMLDAKTAWVMFALKAKGVSLSQGEGLGG